MGCSRRCGAGRGVGVRRGDRELPVIRKERPKRRIAPCHDEDLLHTMCDVDGALVGYGSLTPGPLIGRIAAGDGRKPLYVLPKDR